MRGLATGISFDALPVPSVWDFELIVRAVQLSLSFAPALRA